MALYRKKNHQKICRFKKTRYLCTRFKTLRISIKGEMVEWSITTVLKTVVPRGTGGSNPSLSATYKDANHICGSHFLFVILILNIMRLLN